MEYTLHKLPEGFIITSDEEIKEGELSTDLQGIFPFHKENPCQFIFLTPKKVIAQQDQIDFSNLTQEEPNYNMKEEIIVEMERLEQEPKQETIEEIDYLQGFINQFEEGHKQQELSNDNWSVSQFLEWLQLNNFKIIK